MIAKARAAVVRIKGQPTGHQRLERDIALRRQRMIPRQSGYERLLDQNFTMNGSVLDPDATDADIDASIPERFGLLVAGQFFEREFRLRQNLATPSDGFRQSSREAGLQSHSRRCLGLSSAVLEKGLQVLLVERVLPYAGIMRGHVFRMACLRP